MVADELSSWTLLLPLIIRMEEVSPLRQDYFEGKTFACEIRNETKKSLVLNFCLRFCAPWKLTLYFLTRGTPFRTIYSEIIKLLTSKAVQTGQSYFE